MKRFFTFCVVLIALTSWLNTANAQIRIPEPVPPPPAIRTAFDLSPFYQQWIDVDGFPILASAKVSPYAVKEVAWVIRNVTRHRPDVLQAMAEAKVRFSILGINEKKTDIPAYRRIFPEPHFFYDMGRGGYCSRCLTAGAPEETVLDEGWYSVTIHEFAHAFHEAGLNTIDPTFDDRLRTTYNAAMARGLWKNTYASTNMSEYWAQGVGTWFHANPVFRSVVTRRDLKDYDPGLAALLAEIFGDGAWRYTLPASRTHLPHLQGFNPQEAPRLEHPPELLEIYRQFTSNPDNDGGGEWVNLEPYPPSQLPRLNRSRTIGDSTSVVYFMNHTGATAQVYRVKPNGEEVFWRNVTSSNKFRDFWMNIGSIFLVKDNTGKNIAVFLVDEKTRGSIVRAFVGNPGTIEKNPITGTWLFINEPPHLTPDTFTIGPGEFAILVHQGARDVTKKADFKTYASYRTPHGNADLPNFAEFFRNGGRIELVSHASKNPLPPNTRPPQFGDVVISEIMWGLNDASPAKQYIELYNTSADTYTFTDGDLMFRFSKASEAPLPEGIFAPSFNTNVKVKAIDHVSNKDWKVPGQSGNISKNKPLLSMYRTIDDTTGSVPDGTLADSWKPSSGRVNLLAPSFGTPGAKHLPPTPVVLVEASQRPPMYWVDTKAGTLHRLIGNTVENLLPSVRNATRLAVDAPRSRLYWTTQTNENWGKIYRINLKGTLRIEALRDLYGVPLDIAVDPQRKHLYWIDALNRIQRADLNAQNIENVLRDLKAPKHITLDVGRGKLYWTEQTNDQTREIRSAHLDGSNIQSVQSLTSVPRGLALDAITANLYLTTADGKVQRLNVDGSNFQPNLITGLDAPGEVFVDAVGRNVYWTKQDSIWRADLNGKNIEIVVTGFGTPTGIVIGTLPAVAPAAPALVDLPPEATVLLVNYPNPFNPETWIPYQLAAPATVTVSLYDMKGALIRTLTIGHRPAGDYTDRNRAAYWDGRNSIGEPVASGVYFYTLTAGEVTATRKLLIRK